MFTFCACIILYLLVVFAITLPYWYEAGNAPRPEGIPTPSWSLRSVIQLWLEAAWYALLLGAALPLDPILRRIGAAPIWPFPRCCLPIDPALRRADAQTAGNGDRTPPPVFLVHGLYHNPSGWMFLRPQLQKAGFSAIHTMAYSSWKTDISALTATLDAEISRLESRYPGAKPLLVGHSLGGLLIRNWLAAKENQGRILGAVTLGAPHQGSKIAALAFGKLGRSLIPTNPFFAELARTEHAATIPCVSFVSEADTMVLPQRNLVPATKGWEMRLTPYATHAGLLVKRSIRRMVVWELHRMASMSV